MSDEAKGGYNFGDKVTNPKDTNGYIGQTVWDGAQRDREANKYYCAVEVRFDDAQELLDSNQLGNLSDEEIALLNQGGIINLLATMGYYFVVKCTIDIWSNVPDDFPRTSGKGKYDDLMLAKLAQKGEIGKENIDNDNNLYTPGMQRVKTIVSYQPIDIFFQESDVDFDPVRVLKNNWPLEIQYDARGCNPTVTDEYLEFRYGARPDTEAGTPVPLV